MLCLQSQKLQGKSSITRSGTLQTRAEKACLDVLSRLDADLPVYAVHGVAAAFPSPLTQPHAPLAPHYICLHPHHKSSSSQKPPHSCIYSFIAATSDMLYDKGSLTHDISFSLPAM